MRVLVTGNMGYIGPVLARFFAREFPLAELVGFDAGFFGHCLTASDSLPEVLYARQYYGDIRELPPSVLEGIDVIVHLAAVSNDPMGNEFAEVTEEINRKATARLAMLAERAGVSHFVFASSCSMYGAADSQPRREGDPTNPLTAYARSKIGAEEDLRQLSAGNMVITSLRFSTACGMSERLRLDLVLNDFVASAVTTGRIDVLSDGTPWRPLIDVEDMARAISWAARRSPEQGGKFLAVNAGRDENNVQVADLAAMVGKLIPGTVISINRDAPPDKRSYMVDFSLFKELAPENVPEISLEQSVRRLIDGVRKIGLSGPNFRESQYVRLKVLREHIASGRIGRTLRWEAGASNGG